MFKSKLLNALIMTVLSAPGVTLAADAPATPPAPVFTSNVGFVTNYIFRGVSQSGAKPALQGGFDYTPASGFYAGAWGSSISWLSDARVADNAGLELDTYLGFRNSFATDFSYDVGYLRYNYPGKYAAGATKADTD